MLRPLQRHQQRGKLFILQHNHRAGVFMAPGTGKTLTAIRAVAASPGPVLVTCRRDDFKTWRDELLADGVPDNELAFIDSGKQVQDWTETVGSIIHGNWTLVTYDLHKQPVVKDYLIQCPFKWVIADESHMIKRWESARTKAVYHNTRHIPYRLPMTGTPITNDPKDVFSQVLFIDDGATFGKSEWKFLQKYYIREGHGWYIRKGARQQIERALASLSFYVHEDDVLTLPPLRHLTKAAPLSEQQLAKYEELLNQWQYTLSTGEVIEIDYIVAQLAKLRQVASGFIYEPVSIDPPVRRTVYLDCPKYTLLMDLLEDPDYLLHKDVVIWAAHDAEIERILAGISSSKVIKKYGYKAVGFYGNLSTKQREQNRTIYKESKQHKYFVAQVDRGVGMNELIKSANAVYFSNSHRVVSRLQSLRRIRRKGTEQFGHDVITYWDLVTERTVDESIIKSVGASMSLASMILNSLKQGFTVRQALDRSMR